MKRLYCSLILILIFLVHYGDAQCFLPSDLTGAHAWYSGPKGALNFTNNNSNTTIQVYPTSKFGDLSLSCYLNDGKKYVFKSDSFSFLGLNFEVYTCLKVHRITNVKYIYYEGSTVNTDADDERLKSELVATGSTPTLSSICDRSTYPQGSELMLLRNDGNEVASSIKFPYRFRGKYKYTFTSGGDKFCSNKSAVDTCTMDNSKTMLYDYDKCSTIQAYSANGRLKCMYTTSDSRYTYMHVYNTDSTTDESTTYRFTCYVIQRRDTKLYATQYPRYCATDQTATNVTSPGAVLVYRLTESCPFDSSSTVLSTASAAGIAVGLLLLIIIIVCGVLIWYYYKKRKQRDVEKALLHKRHPANKKLANGSIIVDSKGTKTPRALNGNANVHLETDPSIRRENSIHISMTSRQGSGLDGLEGDRKPGCAPVETPEVNYISDDVIIESEAEELEAEEVEPEAPHESTFLPLTPHERNELHFTDEEIKEIERRSAAQNLEVERFDNDMDRVDDELGLPRLSRAFTPIIQPEMPTLPAVAYKKKFDSESESEDDKRPDGIKKVKLKKRSKKKRVQSSKIKGSRRAVSRQMHSESMRETPFLERIKKQDHEKTELEQREKLEKEMRDIENEVIKARVSLGATTPATNKSTSSLRLSKSRQLHPVVNTWWTDREIKTFDQQIKELQSQRRQELKDDVLAIPPLKIPVRTVKEHQGSDILWKYKEVMKGKTKGKGSKKQKISGKKKKGQEVGDVENIPKHSQSPRSKKTHSIIEMTSPPEHPLSLRPGTGGLALV